MHRSRHTPRGTRAALAILVAALSVAVTPLARAQEPLDGPGPGKQPGPELHPLLDVIAARVDSALYAPWVRRLSGAEPAQVGGAPHTFTTRFSISPEARLAEQLVFERFTELGLGAAYYPFRMSGTTVRNVIAEIPGTARPREVVLLCGHLDSTSPEPQTRAPGANDNATGAAGVLAAAEILRDYRFQRTLRFVAFMGEEQGLFGAQHYALYGLAPGDSVVAVINLDMIGFHVDRWEIDLDGAAAADPLARVVEETAFRYTDLGTNRSTEGYFGDHMAFAGLGIPALLVIESDFARDPCYHQACDTANRTDAVFGTTVLRAAATAVAHLAGIEESQDAPGTDDDVEAVRPWVGPNPFTASLVIRLPRAPGVPREVAVHDVTGRRLRALDLGTAAPYEIVWDGRTDTGAPVPAGIYFLRVVEGGQSRVVKVVRTR